MVYKFPDVVQQGFFSCVEELRCDAIDNVLRIPEDVDYNNITFLLYPKTARNLYTALLKSNVNGFTLHLFEEMTNEEVTGLMTKSSYVIMAINNQGTIFVEDKLYVEPEWPNDFWYVEGDLYDLVKDKMERYSKKTLVFKFS